jgi:hypothetical protein
MRVVSIAGARARNISFRSRFIIVKAAAVQLPDELSDQPQHWLEMKPSNNSVRVELNVPTEK